MATSQLQPLHVVFLLVIFAVLLPKSSMSSLSSSSSYTDADAEAITRFQRYLQIDTSHPTPNYQEARAFLYEQAKSIDLEAESLELATGKPIVLLKWKGTDPKLSSILLNSHTDVVASEPEKWRYPPFSAEIDPNDGYIYARGSQDMKCVGMQYLEAVRRLKADPKFRPRRTIYLSFVPDEEIGGRDGVGRFVNDPRFGKLNVGIALDEGVPSETGEFYVFYAERAGWWLNITAKGHPGHGSLLYENSAMENLQKSLETIARFRQSQFDMVKAGIRDLGSVVTVNTVFLKAGTPSDTGFVMNIQPSEAEAGFDIRVPPNATAEDLDRRIAEEWAPQSRNMSSNFTVKSSLVDVHGNPLITQTDDSNPWWRLFRQAVTKAGGTLHEPAIHPGSSDSRYFREKGIPAFGFSPMAHTPILPHDHNERIHPSVYLKGIDVYRAIIEAYASYEGKDRLSIKHGHQSKEEL